MLMLFKNLRNNLHFNKVYIMYFNKSLLVNTYDMVLDLTSCLLDHIGYIPVSSQGVEFRPLRLWVPSTGPFLDTVP